MGQSNVTPRVIAVGALSYSTEKLFGMAQVRRIGHGRFDTTYVEGVNVNDNTVAGATYLNLSGSFNPTPRLQVFAVINNALNRDPPIVAASFGLPTMAIYFDTVGRSFRLGVRYKH